jgi:hypothetical protein
MKSLLQLALEREASQAHNAYHSVSLMPATLDSCTLVAQ